MNSNEKRGRIYLTLFVSALILFDLLIKVLFVALGNLRWSQVVGTLITLATCWFLWRGSRGAYWFLLTCLALACAYAFAMFFKTSLAPVAFIGVFVLALILALAAPATRKFTAYQRATRA